ncbi:MAG: metallophosphoesterase, partial [Draconibacterium sp.]|nr:metallophosphoesterase [Draconibacterium sp.]
VYAGDLINVTNSEKEWQEWFHAGDFIHATIPSIMTPGNHEYDSTALDNHWRPQFTLPLNGPDHPLLSEVCYFVDYNNLRIISIDADIMTESHETIELTKNWLESILKNNTKTWTMLTLHYPFYSTKSNRDNPELRRLFQPILEKYNVDMVITGHDHAYGRGMHTVKSMTNEDEISGPMYVVSVSGPKMYDLSDKGWMTRKAGNTQLFQVITIDGKKLNLKAYTASGQLYDEFNLRKRKNKPNKLTNKIPDIPERLYSR